MLNFYGYIFIIFIVIFLMIKALYISKFSPAKIKIAAIVVIIIMMMRYFSMLILSLAYNIKYLYLLKTFFFLNFLGVPLLALIVLYIFIRKDNINFSYVFIVAVAMISIYGLMIYKCAAVIYGNCIYGYTMEFTEYMYLYWIFIIINTMILFLAISLIKNKNVNRLGISLVIVASLVTIVENILWIIGIRIFQESIIGEMLWTITIVYALNKVKKKKTKKV